MSKMLQRRLFVIVFFTFAAGVFAAILAEPANRKFIASNGARFECNDDPGGTTGSLCRKFQGNRKSRVEIHRSDENGEQHKDTDKIINSEEDSTGNKNGDQTAINEARGKKDKKKGYYKIFFMMAAAAKATMLYAMIHAVALLAGKALVVAKVALALAAAVALKKALEHKEKTSYEIVKHPHNSYVQTHSASIDYDHGGGSSGGYEGGHRRRRRHAR